MPHGLTLFRRHEKGRSRDYPKDFRIHEHDSPKAMGKKRKRLVTLSITHKLSSHHDPELDLGEP